MYQYKTVFIVSNKYIDKIGRMRRLIWAITISTWYEHIKILDLVCINAKQSNVAKVLVFLLFEWKTYTSSENSDQTLRLRGLIWIFIGRVLLFHLKSVQSASRLRQSIAQSIVCGYLLIPPHHWSHTCFLYFLFHALDLWLWRIIGFKRNVFYFFRKTHIHTTIDSDRYHFSTQCLIDSMDLCKHKRPLKL